MYTFEKQDDRPLVQFYEKAGDAHVFFDGPITDHPWNISAPPNGKLTLAMLTKIMEALRYKPVGKWKGTDWGSERKFVAKP